MNRGIGLAVVLLAAVGVGCGNGSSSGVPSSSCQDAGTVSYAANVSAVLMTYCGSCHSSTLTGAARQGAPTAYNVDTYQSAAAAAQAFSIEIQLGRMPPGGGMPTCDKQLVKTWAEIGAP